MPRGGKATYKRMHYMAGLYPTKIQRSQSLVPPSIVELSSNRVVLAWRATRGSCSIRTEAEFDATDSQEWANLENDEASRPTCKTSRINYRRFSRKKAKATRVEVLEVDHVELQTCSCGCPQCIRGEEDPPPAQEGQPAAGCACTQCSPEYGGGLGCWRSVYQGPGCRCQIELQHGNALHHFRLLVRARRPPPERRGFRRPRRQDSPTTTSKCHGMAPSVGDNTGDNTRAATFVHDSPQRPSSQRRRRKRHSGIDIDYSDADRSDPPLTLIRYDDVLSHDTDSMEGGVECRMSAGTTSPPLENEELSSNSPVRWFSSASVFVDSRPPPISLHGIGTALVLTWPPPARFSGSENVSYILEQWSHITAVATYSNATTVTSEMPTTSRGNCRFQNRPQEKSGRQLRRHHHHHQGPYRPKPSDDKEVFSVGTRCWFVPSPLENGKRYWYRLRLVHEGGRSVAGPWASHVTSVDPPRCIETSQHGLVLTFPHAIGDHRVDRVRVEVKDTDGSRYITPETQLPSSSTSQRHPSTMTTAKTEGHAAAGEDSESDREPDAASGSTHERYGSLTEGNGAIPGNEREVPVVWYTLEGLEKTGSRWIELYLGSSSEVIVEGLDANTLNAFRVGIEVDMTELRRRSLGPLESLGLESPPPSGINAFRPLSSNTSTATFTLATMPPRSLRYSNNNCTSLGVIRPAFRRKNGGSPATLLVAPGGSPGRRLPWNPASNAVMSQMRREGFSVHDVAATSGGGFYLEPPLPLSRLGRLQGSNDTAGTEGSVNGDGGQGWFRRDYSDRVAFSTGPAAPRFAAFVAGGVEQVKVWWAEPQHAVDTSPPGGPHPPVAAIADSATVQTSMHINSTSAESNESAYHYQGLLNHVTTAHKGGDDDGNTPALLRSPVFTLDVLDPVSGCMRSVCSGPDLWADIGRSSSSSSPGDEVPITPATAYFVRLSARTSCGQPEGTVGSVVLTAPPAPVLELVGGGVADDTGVATLRAFWTTDVTTSFLPTGENLPRFSTALEMAQAWEAGPPHHGVGRTTATVPVSRSATPGRRYAHAPRDVEKREGGGTQDSGRVTSNGRQCRPSSEAGHAADVKVDAGGGLCWTLGASSWGKPPGGGRTTRGFRVIWRGFDGESEAFTPPLPPGMRFAFRVRIECCYGVALSAVTVYQTARVLPLPPKGLAASLATHESRAGTMSKCVRLSWGPPEPGHGKNVVTSFTVEALRQPQARPGDAKSRREHDAIGAYWRHVCSCPNTSCLDPDTLGIAHITADYRVRAEGPGGIGPWCELLHVDLVSSVASDAPNYHDPDPAVTAAAAAKLPATGSGGGGGGGGGGGVMYEKEPPPPERPMMSYVRPGSRERDSLTGEVRRRPWTARRPHRHRRHRQRSVIPSSPSAVAVMPPSTAVVAAQHRQRRVSNHKKVLSGRARNCWAPGLCKGRNNGGDHGWWTAAVVGGTANACRRADGTVKVPIMNQSADAGQQDDTAAAVGAAAVEAMAAPPYELQMVLAEEIGISSAMGIAIASVVRGSGTGGLWRHQIAEGNHGAAGSTSNDGLSRRSPDIPVVAWIPPYSSPPPPRGDRDQNRQRQGGPRAKKAGTGEISLHLAPSSPSSPRQQRGIIVNRSGRSKSPHCRSYLGGRGAARRRGGEEDPSASGCNGSSNRAARRRRASWQRRRHDNNDSSTSGGNNDAGSRGEDVELLETKKADADKDGDEEEEEEEPEGGGGGSGGGASAIATDYEIRGGDEGGSDPLPQQQEGKLLL